MALWRRHGRYVIALAVATVLGVAAFNAWQSYRERQRLAEGRAYVQAIDWVVKDDVPKATTAMAAIAANGGGYRLLALLEEASLKAKAGNTAGAVKIYDAMAADESAGRPFRDLATILAVLASLDSGDASALGRRVQPLAAEGQAFRPSALELQGLLALRQGDFKAATKSFRALSDDTGAPSGLRQRAAQILSWIGERGGA